MAKNSVRQWDATAANNTDISGISLAENVTKPSDVNNFERAHMSQVAQYVAEMSYPTAGGTADALTLTPTTALAALANNVVYTATIAFTNATTTPTLAVSGLTAKVIRKIVSGADVAVAIGDQPAGYAAQFLYSTAANSAGGAWILVNPAVTVSSTSIATVASATSTLIGAASSAEVNITGTTTITSFDTVAAGTVREGYFSGALILTHNATSLIIPGGQSVTTAANDRFRALSLGSGNWLLLWYRTASGVELNDLGISTIASATTTNIAAAGTYNQVSITGTTTITSFGTANAGIVRRGSFTGALTLTYNATSLIVPSAASITTAAGDTFEAISLGSGNWRVNSYIKANGTAVVASSGGMTLIGTLTTTSGTTQSLTGIAAGYIQFYCEFDGVSSSGTSVSVTVALSSTGGAAYGAAGVALPINSAASDVWSGYIVIGNVSSTLAAAKTFSGPVAINGALPATSIRTVPTNTAAVADAIQFACTSAFDAGSIRVYGVK